MDILYSQHNLEFKHRFHTVRTIMNIRKMLTKLRLVLQLDQEDRPEDLNIWLISRNSCWYEFK